MPIDFSILNQTNPSFLAGQGMLKAVNEDLNRKQQEQQSQRQFSVQNDQNFLKQQEQQNTADYQQGQLSNARQQIGINQQQANQQGQYQSGLLNQGQQDLGLKQQEITNTKDYRTAALSQQAKEATDLNQYRQGTLALQNKGLDLQDKQSQARLGLDTKRFNMDNSRNLFDQALQLHQQANADQLQANTQLTFDQHQKYLQDVANSTTLQEKQQAALDHGQIDDALKFADTDQKNMALAQQKGTQAFGVGLYGMLTQVAQIKDPSLQGQTVENYLRRASATASQLGDIGTLNILQEATRLKDPTERLLFLTHQGSFQAQSVGQVMQNPAQNIGALPEAQAALDPSNPYAHPNLLNPNNTGQLTAQQIAQYATGTPTMTMKEYDKASELKQTRNDAALQEVQADADKKQKIADMSAKQFQNAQLAYQNASGPTTQPGPAYKALVPGIMGKISLGTLSNVYDQTNNAYGGQISDNSQYIEKLREGQQDIALARAGKIDKNDPNATRMLKDLMAVTPGPDATIKSHALNNLEVKQSADDANAKAAALQSWILQGNNPSTFNKLYWNAQQEQRDADHKAQIESLNRNSNPEDLSRLQGDLATYIKAKQGQGGPQTTYPGTSSRQSPTYEQVLSGDTLK